ncbi:RNA polymerase sigma factor, partial [Deinococcus pimensis]|uniref:RNA polymerase sigma factor n=1 Tax=Deinococcus pimensis TaxID=309888 RepID=UPI0006944130
MDTEVELMLRLRARDEAALSELHGLLSGHVHALALRMLGSREEAEEVVQDTFVRIFERARQYRPELGSPRAFVYTVARHEALSRLRARSARPQRAAGTDDDAEVTIAVDAPDLTSRVVVEAA